ncbi:MAG: flippase [Calditrichia bacterium]
MPLITIPYIVRVVGPANFGLLSFAQVVSSYFEIITDYGFNISATQIIAKNQKNSEKTIEAFNAVFWIKIVLMVLCFSILFIVSFFVEEVAKYRFIYFFYFLMVPGNVLFSNWLFLGMEEMKYLTYPNFVSKLVYTVLIFSFLREETQYALVAAFFGLSWIAGGATGFIIAFKRYKLKLKLIKFRVLKKYFLEGWHIFISTFAISLYRQSNVFILGLFANNAFVGYYSAAEKIVKVIQSIFNPVIQAFYPFVSRKTASSKTQGITIIKKLSLGLFLTGAALVLIIVFSADFATPIFLGKKFLASIPVLKITSFSIIFSLLNYAIGIIFMTNFGLKKWFTSSVIITGLFNLVFCSVLSYNWHHTGAAISFTVAEIFLFFLLILFTFKNKEMWTAVNER